MDDWKALCEDIIAHATPFGDIPDDPGWVGSYLVSAGAIHRAAGKLGRLAPACDAEALLREWWRQDGGPNSLDLALRIGAVIDPKAASIRAAVSTDSHKETR
jgi:hypothetical protein